MYVSVFLNVFLGVEFLNQKMTRMSVYLRDCQTCFVNGSAVLPFHQQCTWRASVSLYTHQHLFSSVFFILAILLDVKWYLPHCGFDLHFPSG